MNVFDAQGIRKTYGETRAVDGVDLSLAAGEIVTILGHNGSGKTTFLECVEGLRKPDAGTVTLCGKVHTYGSPLPEGVGVQMQQEQLPPRIKVREALSLFASIYGVDGPPPDLMQAMTIEARGQALRYAQWRTETSCEPRTGLHGRPANRLPRRTNGGAGPRGTLSTRRCAQKPSGPGPHGVGNTT